MSILSVVSMAIATDKATKDGYGGNGSRSGWIEDIYQLETLDGK